MTHHRLVAFVGFKSSGKNTAAQPLVEHRGCIALSFADALKDALAAIFCWSREMLEGISDESRTWREAIDGWWAERLGIPHFTPRWAMQNFGTEIMRAHFHPEIWVLNVERRIMVGHDTPIVLIDARFPNEIALAIRLGGQIVRVQRGPDPEWAGVARSANAGNVMQQQRMHTLGVHRSEWAWLGSAVDMTLINDSSIADLHARSLEWYDLSDRQHQMRQ